MRKSSEEPKKSKFFQFKKAEISPGVKYQIGMTIRSKIFMKLSRRQDGGKEVSQIDWQPQSTELV